MIHLQGGCGPGFKSRLGPPKNILILLFTKVKENGCRQSSLLISIFLHFNPPPIFARGSTVGGGQFLNGGNVQRMNFKWVIILNSWICKLFVAALSICMIFAYSLIFSLLYSNLLEYFVLFFTLPQLHLSSSVFFLSFLPLFLGLICSCCFS